MLPRFIQACRRESVDRTPVWFMRQAGRYMPQYRKIRASHSILDICKTPRLAAEVTQQPVDALDVDAAIIFADLLLPLEPMGLKLEFVQGNGPKIANPVRSSADVARLAATNAADLGYVAETVSLVKKNLSDRVPIIGFVGAPFTLASYMIEGGGSRNYAAAKYLMWSEPAAWQGLMEKIVQVITPYAASQVLNGADAIQIFDSWAGALAPDDYERHVLPYSEMLIRQIQSTSVPVIHFGTGNGLSSNCSTPRAGTCWASIGGFVWMRLGAASAKRPPCRAIWIRSPCSLRCPSCAARSRMCSRGRPDARGTFSTWGTESCLRRRWTT